MEQKNDSKNLVIYLLIAGLLGAGGYIWYSKTKEKEVDTKQEATIAQKTQENMDLDVLYKETVADLDSITGLNTSLNGQILDKNGEIGKLKMEIENKLRELNQARKEGKDTRALESSLRAEIAKFKSRVADLEGQVAKLQEQNKVLTDENTTVKTNLQTKETELAATKTTLDQTTTEKKNLETTVDVGQTLSAINFYITGINEKRGGKEKETSTAKKVDKLRIGFDLDANRIATSGKKEIFVCLTAPDGTPVTVEALGSGTFNTRDGQKFFTSKLDIDYVQGEKKNVNFDWKQNSDFQRGDYKVEVYQNGFKIGESRVTLKKGGLFG